MKLMQLRASAAPMNMLCPGSARSAELRIDDSGEPARLGTAAHEALALLVETGSIPWEELPAIAHKHDVHETELRVLVAQGAKMWAQIASTFPGAVTELELSADIAPNAVLTGHVDLLSIQSRAARAADWKTGRKDSDYGQQMQAYCALILLENSDLDEATVTIPWVRDDEIENYTMLRKDLQAWVSAYVARVVDWDGVFHPGAHCQYCPRSHECEAANAKGRRDVALLADRGIAERAESTLALMAPHEILDLQGKADTVIKCAKRVLDAIKAHVQSSGDIVHNGERLTITTRETKDVDALKAWPILESHGFGDEEFAQCVKLSLSKANSVAAVKAGRGKGAAAVRELRAKLDEAGAISVNEQQILARKRA